MKKTIFIFIILILIIVLPLKTLDTWMTPDIRLDTGDTAGASNSYNPQIACSGTNVYAVWEDIRNGSEDIYFNFSGNNGVNWQSSDIRLDVGDTSGANQSLYPQIACTGGYVYVVWHDRRNGNFDIYFNYSSDNGVNWQSTDIRLDTGDTPGAYSSEYPQIACTGNHVYVVWHDIRYSTYDIYFNYSSDNGATFQSSDIRLDTGDWAGANHSVYPQVACSGNNVYVVWSDFRNGNEDIYFTYSNDNGVNWLSSDIRLDTGDTPGANQSLSSRTTCSGSNVFVMWADTRNGSADIYFNYSHNYGVTWQPTDIRLDTGDTAGASLSLSPQITSSGNSVYAVWRDARNGSPDIYFNFSTDSGPTWQSSDIRLDTGDPPGASTSISPQISSSGNYVYAVWQDERNGNLDIYLNYSNDNGATWKPSGIRLDTGDGIGLNTSIDPQITCSENNVSVVWEDYRNGNSDIYFNGTIPTTDIKANGSDGPVTITQSDTLQIRVSLASFGSTANVDYWLAYKGPSGWVHFNNFTKKWESGLGVTHQGPLMDLNNKKVFQSKLTPGNYTFYFGVDMDMNGKVTKSSLYKDEVKVTVTSN